MRSSVWAALLRQIPPEQHNTLMLVTMSGIEITLQNILRIDDEFLAFRGRLAGSQDAGRLYFIPLNNIDYFGFSRAVKDEEYAEIFGNLQVPPPDAPPTVMIAAPVVAPAPASELPAPEPAPEPEPTPPVAASAPPVAPSRTAPPQIKSEILERFRSRNTSSGATPRPPNG
jgi:hypothetical protein